MLAIQRRLLTQIEQGHIVDMPSLILTRSLRTGETVEVFVGGGGIVMLEGQFLV